MFWLEAIKNCYNIFCDLFFLALVFVESCIQSSTDQSSQNTKKKAELLWVVAQTWKDKSYWVKPLEI